MSAPARARSACSPPQPAPVLTGSQGSVAKVPLRPAVHGWCRGRYTVTVMLERTVTCGPLATPGSMVCCGPPVEAAAQARMPLCPVSADTSGPHSADGLRSYSALDTGTTHFTVR